MAHQSLKDQCISPLCLVLLTREPELAVFPAKGHSRGKGRTIPPSRSSHTHTHLAAVVAASEPQVPHPHGSSQECGWAAVWQCPFSCQVLTLALGSCASMLMLGALLDGTAPHTEVLGELNIN